MNWSSPSQSVSGSKRWNALLTQLRVGRSLLNVHSFAINLADSPLCQCARLETNLHFFTECFLYTEERRLLYDSMEQILPKFKTLSNENKLEIFLHGINLTSDETDSRNSKIIFVVQNFILKTKRFWPSLPFPKSLFVAALIFNSFILYLTLYLLDFYCFLTKT